MSDSYYSEVNDHGTVVPLRDLLAFPRSEQTVLGAKNLCSNIPAFTLLKSGDRTKNNIINETPNIGTYKVSFTISDAANITKQGGIQIGDSAGNWSESADGVFDVVNGRVVLTIPFAHAVSRVYVFLNGNDGDTATATFSDFMITFATDPDSTFVPPAMTNKELTDELQEPELSGVDVNTLVEPKRYHLVSNITNLPSGVTTGVLDVIKITSAGVPKKQILYPSGSPTKFYIRDMYSNGTWSAWCEFTGTVIS